VIALFAGTFSIAMAAMSISNGYERVMGQRGSDEGYNLLVLASPETSEQAAAQMFAQGAQQVYTSYSIDGARLNEQSVTISGRTAADVAADVTIMDDTALANWADDAKVALLPVGPYQEQFAVGDKIILQVGEQQLELTISGFYAPPTAANTQFLQPTTAVLVPRQVALALGGERVQTAVMGAFPVAELDATADLLGENLTDALVFSKADLNDALLGIYRALLTFAVSVAGLALVAGAVLIANSAGLLIVERRREIGIFKSVGYTSGHVLRLLLSEYGLLGFMGGAFGIIGVAIALFLINTSTPQAQMTFEPLIGAGMTLLSMLIALGSAALVAWQPTRVRPLDVLRYE
jgi:putative ABC transport system permease protein